jgi:hypothetical protein
MNGVINKNPNPILEEESVSEIEIALISARPSLPGKSPWWKKFFKAPIARLRGFACEEERREYLFELEVLRAEIEVFSGK